MVLSRTMGFPAAHDRFSFLMIITLAPAPAFGESYSLYNRSDLKTKQPLLDGVLDESVWQQAAIIEFRNLELDKLKNGYRPRI